MWERVAGAIGALPEEPAQSREPMASSHVGAFAYTMRRSVLLFSEAPFE
jgi:hypothetical protein